MDDLGAYFGEFSAALAPSVSPLVRIPVVLPDTAALLRPSFAQTLAAVKALTDALNGEYQTRNARGTRNTTLGSPFLVMPDCPTDGPWGYVYRDIFDASKENLRVLNETGANGTPEENFAWASLVRANAALLRGATNIADMFLFPTGALPGAPTTEMTPDEAARSVRESVPWRTPSGALYANARATVRGYRTDEGGNEPSEILASANQLGLQTVSRVRTLRPDWYELAVRQVLALPGNMSKPVRDAGSDLAAQMRAMVPFLVMDPSTTPSDWGSDGNYRALQFESLMARARPGPGPVRFWFPYLHLAHLRLVARVYSALDLNKILTDAFGFYAFNHNVHYAAKLGLTNEQVRAMQTAAMQTQTAAIFGTATAVYTAVNPILGLVVGLVGALTALLIQWQGAATGDVFESPFSLFRRVPRVGCTTATAEPTVPGTTPGTPGPGPGTTPPPAVCPTGTTGTPPNCIATPKKSSPLVWGAGALLLFALIRKRT